MSSNVYLCLSPIMSRKDFPCGKSFFCSSFSGSELLNLNSCASLFKLALTSSASSLEMPSFTGLGRCQRDPWLLSGRGGEFTNNLDNVDLLLASAGEDYVKLGLLFNSFGGGSGSGYSHGAAADTPNFSSIAFTSSLSSKTVIFSIAYRISSLVISKYPP